MGFDIVVTSNVLCVCNNVHKAKIIMMSIIDTVCVV